VADSVTGTYDATLSRLKCFMECHEYDYTIRLYKIIEGIPPTTTWVGNIQNAAGGHSIHFPTVATHGFTIAMKNNYIIPAIV
jgi:hypothetical protein